MINALFVYGTLRPGQENEDVLSCIEGTFKRASIKGVHYPNGWIEGFPYPGIELDEEGMTISGYVFSSPVLYQHWGRLDAFEGPNYERVISDALLENDTVVTVYVYVINRDGKDSW